MVRPGLRSALALGLALAAFSLVVTPEAAPSAGPRSSPPGSAAGVTTGEGRLDLAVLDPGRHTHRGFWSQRRLTTHPSALFALLVGAALLCLTQAGAVGLYSAPQILSLARGAAVPRGPPVLQLT